MKNSGKVDCLILPTSGIKLRPQGGEVPKIPIIYGEDVSTTRISLPMSPDMLPSTPVLLTHRRVLDVHAQPAAVYLTIYFVAGTRSFCGVNIIAAIPGFSEGLKKGIFRKLNNFCSKIPFLVQATVSGSLVRSPCATLVVAVFDS